MQTLKLLIMKRFISILLASMFIIGLSLNLSAQSSEDELDQVELIKQFQGTWEWNMGKDTLTLLSFTPQNDGFLFVQENKANGEAYETFKGVIGFSNDKQMIYVAGTTRDGTLILDNGKFETKTTCTFDRYYGNTSHAAEMVQWEFLTPESCVARAKWRGDGMAWPTDWNDWGTLKKVK